MKVSARSTVTTIVEGEIGVTELLDGLVKRALHIPEGVNVTFSVGDPPHDVDLNEGEPLRFRLIYTREAPLPPEVTTPTG